MSNSRVPKMMFFTKGVGKDKTSLQAFEAALRNAGIAHLNLVKVSSIFPPGCKIVGKNRGIKKLQPGQVTHVVLAECRTNEPNRLACAGVGLAVPASGQNYGYISEHHGFGLTEKKCGDLVEDMAATMLATTLGIEFDPDTDYDSRREIYRMSGQIVESRAIVQTAEGDKTGLWTAVVAAAVFVPADDE
ncbi:MAG: arginine decarboxylase, pyruvoyl-dependent [Phycisphaerae bacterium]|mgnify:CR=1 FL=1|nr:arginine decarboxylase, pyruvoyl-dependent [Phycisphaerae bacterium]